MLTEQYYVFTKEPMPMDIEFVVQDLFALLRPKWTIATTFEDASKKFAEACKSNFQNTASTSREPEIEEPEELPTFDDGQDDGDDDFDNVNGRSASESEVEVSIRMRPGEF